MLFKWNLFVFREFSVLFLSDKPLFWLPIRMVLISCLCWHEKFCKIYISPNLHADTYIPSSDCFFPPLLPFFHILNIHPQVKSLLPLQRISSLCIHLIFILLSFLRRGGLGNSYWFAITINVWKSLCLNVSCSNSVIDWVSQIVSINFT